MATQFANGKIVTDGLVLCLDAADQTSYPTTGTTWFDLAGSNNGTLTNGPTFSGTGASSSIVFDGTDDYVNCGKPSLLNFGTGSFSISMFFFVTSGNKLQILADKGNTSNVSSSGWYINLDNRYSSNLNGLSFGVNSTSVNTSFATVSTVSPYVANQWNNVTVIWDGVGKNSLIYLNSVLMTTTLTQTQGSGLAGITNTDNSNFNTVLGAYDNGASLFFNGRISATQIYNRALSASEILQNYNSQKSRFGIS
jgi:hypothetical protein